MRTIKKIDQKSAASLYAYFLAISAFLMGLFVAFANIAERIATGGDTVGAMVFIIIFNILWGVLIGLISALVGAIIGYIFGWIFAVLYNTATKLKFLKGLKIDLE